MSDYQLGDRVIMTGTAEKTHIEDKTTYVSAPLPRCYDSVVGGMAVNEGIVIGRRFMQEGTTDYSGYEGERVFHTNGTTHRVWIVSYDLRRKPVMCFDHQISKEAEK